MLDKDEMITTLTEENKYLREERDILLERKRDATAIGISLIGLRVRAVKAEARAERLKKGLEYIALFEHDPQPLVAKLGQAARAALAEEENCETQELSR